MFVAFFGFHLFILLLSSPKLFRATPFFYSLAVIDNHLNIIVSFMASVVLLESMISSKPRNSSKGKYTLIQHTALAMVLVNVQISDAMIYTF